MILGAEMLREPWPIQKVFMAPGQICVCDGPTFAKGSQEKIKTPGGSSTVSQRGEGTTGEHASPPDCVLLLIPGMS